MPLDAPADGRVNSLRRRVRPARSSAGGLYTDRSLDFPRVSHLLSRIGMGKKDAGGFRTSLMISMTPNILIGGAELVIRGTGELTMACGENLLQRSPGRNSRTGDAVR